jgi:molybdenum cofactor guanylyltransferase
MLADRPPTLGVVLAGGRARRLGGADKARLRVGGSSILDRVVTRLAPQCEHLILNANGDASRFSDTGLTIVADSIADNPGPLAGILAALDWAAEHALNVGWVGSVPADCPFLPHDLVERLHRACRETGARLACAASGHRRHPVIGLWPLDLRNDLRRALVEEGVRKVELWTARYGIAAAAWPSDPVDPFFNVNTPDDLVEANRLAARYADA